MCSGDIGNLFPRISFCDSPFICQIFFLHSSSPIDCKVYSDVAMRVQRIRKWCRGIENCLTYIHRDDRTGLPSIPEIFMKVKRMEEPIPERRPITIRNSSAALEVSTGIVQNIVHEELAHRKMRACRKHRYLSEEQKDRVFETLFLNLNVYKSRKTFLEFLLHVSRHGYAN